MKKIEGVIFDFDGLLFDTERMYCDICIEMAIEFGIKGYDEDYYKQNLGTSNDQLRTLYKKDFSFLSDIEINEFILQVEKVAVNRLEKGDVEPKKGTKELLKLLKEYDIPAVIASNNITYFIDVVLKHHGLRHYIGDIFSRDDVINSKPHPEMVNMAVSSLGSSSESTLMLEDSSHGARAAIAADVPVIIIPDLSEPEEDVLPYIFRKCESLEDVQSFLSRTYLFG